MIVKANSTSPNSLVSESNRIALSERCAGRSRGEQGHFIKTIFKRWFILAMAISLTTSLPGFLKSQEKVVDTFEGPQNSWQLVDFDTTPFAVVAHERFQVQGETESTFESIQFQAGDGTKIYFQHDIDPVAINPELIPSVWIRSNRANISFHALVVLPNTWDPSREGPIQFLVDGPRYSDVGRWQKLTFASLDDTFDVLTRRRIAVYRHAFGADLDTRGAYVTALVMNGYAGGGQTLLQTDTLALEGHIPWTPDLAKPQNAEVDNAQGMGNVPALQVGNRYDTNDDNQSPRLPTLDDPLSGSTHLAKQPVEVSQLSGQIEVNSIPFFARMIDHRGESLRDLRELGFNTVLLTHHPIPEFFDEANQTGMWIICPPPIDDGEPVENSHSRFQQVLAWNLGMALQRDDANRVRIDVQKLIDRRDLPRRPMYAQIQSGMHQFGQILDIIELAPPVFGTPMSSEEYYRWLRTRINEAPQRTTIWASLPTQYPRELLQQARSLSYRINEPIKTPVELEGLAIESLAAGSRGLSFKSLTRLDALDPATHRRERTLRWLNSRLKRLDPWIGAGTFMGREATHADDVVADLVSTSRADLIFVRRRWDQGLTTNLARNIVARPEPTTLFISQSPTTASAYRIDSSGPEPVRHDRAIGTVRIRIEDLSHHTLIVMTQDPLALHHLQHETQQSRANEIGQHADCLADWRREILNSLDELRAQGFQSADAADLTQDAGVNLTKARQLLLTGDLRTANQNVEQCQSKLALATQLLLQTAQAPFPNRMASTVVQAVELLPVHAALSNEIGRLRWSGNLLPAGGMDDLRHIQQTGWNNQKGLDERVTTNVALVAQPNATNGKALELKVEPTDRLPEQARIESTPLWITSPRIRVQRGDMIRVQGRISFENTDPNHPSHLIVIESTGGLRLSERFDSSPQFREFRFYRIATEDGEFQLTFALTGPGRAVIDDLQVMSAPAEGVLSVAMPNAMKR